MKKRISFGKIKRNINYPHFLDIQKESFLKFSQENVAICKRKNIGLQKIFNEHFPIYDATETRELEFMHYTIGVPSHTPEECKSMGFTYSKPLRAKLRLIFKDHQDAEPELIEQVVFMGNMPWITDHGTFIINGVERVIVSQLHRSPGVFFGQMFHANGTPLYSARVIPFKGLWLEFTTDIRNVLWVYIDKKKKIPFTVLLRCLGFYSDQDILDVMKLSEQVNYKIQKKFNDTVVGRISAINITNETEEEVVDENTGEIKKEKRDNILFPRGHEFIPEDYALLKQHKIFSLSVLKGTSEDVKDSLVLNTLNKDTTKDEKSALTEFYFQMRNTDMPSKDTVKALIERLFMNEKRYDIGDVGRHRLNKRLNLQVSEDIRSLTVKDIVAIIKEVILMHETKSQVDDIDHLSNRRVRTVGEQIGQHFSLGLARMARTIKERMNSRDAEQYMPNDLISTQTIKRVINSFFSVNQLSQFMDQTNPLAELTHKRRISALGPGGLTRERAGFDVRDVHYTHYGRLCPIETPEGPNIGLISSLCVYAKINSYGFIETPYFKVSNGKIVNQIKYFVAEQEDEMVIAQANAVVNKEGRFVRDKVFCRQGGSNVGFYESSKVGFIDVASNQIVSVAAGLIPFIEHDDANRALMGSNMQRQSVPLVNSTAPIVGTGMEKYAAQYSGYIIEAEYNGEVKYVNSKKVVIEYDISSLEKYCHFDNGIKTYHLNTFRRSNQDTVINQVPLVKTGDKVKKGQPLVDTSATQNGELALGQNLLVAFMPWYGYNFEDAIVISERVVKDDLYTSIHIQEFEVQVRDTKRGEEEITREIPNIREEMVANLDSQGLAREGIQVKPGDILIGKITPKGEIDPTPEEKLLRAIFGDKASEVKNSSLVVPPGIRGTVMQTNLLNRRPPDFMGRDEEKKLMEQEEKELERNLKKINHECYNRLLKILNGHVSKGVCDVYGKEIFPVDQEYNEDVINQYKDTLSPHEIDKDSPWTTDDATNRFIKNLLINYHKEREKIEMNYKKQKNKIEIGDKLPDGIVQKAKVLVAKERVLQVGDKMAGRHGNKGVVAKIVPEEDMPYMEDGTPVDIVLNPLGVPSRMNLGQIYETILGWAGHKLKKNYATSIFDGASIDDIKEELRAANLPEDGRIELYDGLTGEKFKQKVTVGYIYVMKLNHLVEDKLHARSIGPYSLITQQPLGGKTQFGGQRLGEMEVWALYAYGASNILHEMLTFKSDDVKGRSAVYENIVKGNLLPKGNIPESLNVLLKELQGLCLDISIN